MGFFTSRSEINIVSCFIRIIQVSFKHRRFGFEFFPVILIICGFFGVWELYVHFSGVHPSILPSPIRVFREGWEFRGLIWSNTIPTITETLIGFSVSVTLATIFAISMDFSRLFRRTLYPLLVSTQTIPLIVLAPLMIIWFGFGLTPKIILVALITFFPITVGWVDGFNSSEREASNLLRTMGANRSQIFFKVRLPSAMPSFISGLRIAITYSVIGAVFAEYAGAKSGLGIFMLQQQNAFRTDLVIAAVFIVALVSIGLFMMTYVIERLAIPWYFSTREINRSY